MATNISNESGLSIEGWKTNERKTSTTLSGVHWQMTPNNALARMEFWYSVDGGNTWNERTSKRITDVELNRGAHMEICTRPDGVEAVAVVYVDTSPGGVRRIRFGFGILNGARTDWTWLADHKIVSGDEGSDGLISNPSLITVPLGSVWYTHIFWSKRLNSGTRVRLYWQKIKVVGNKVVRSGNEVRLHHRVATIHARPSCDVRHLGDDYLLFEQSPTVYIAWFIGDAGAPSTNNFPRQYMRRLEYTGSSWSPAEGEKIIFMEDSVQQSMMQGIFNGRAMVSVAVPYSEPETIIMHQMTPENSERKDSIYVPDLNNGSIDALTIGYDMATGDIYIFATGVTDNFPNYIIYDWINETWGSWIQINTEEVLHDTLSCSMGTKARKIALTYARENPSSAGNKQIRFENVTVNLPTGKATWDESVTYPGAWDINTAITLKWFHNDPDGDPQASYKFRRSNDDGQTWQWYNGSTFGTEVAVNSSTDQIVLTAPWASDLEVWIYQVATSDTVGADWGPYSDSVSYLGSVRVDPTIDSPTDTEVIGGPTVDVAWTVSEQVAFKIDWLTGDGLTLIGTSGWIPEPTTRNYEIPYEFANSGLFDIQLTTKNLEGASSLTIKHDITTNYDPPPTPTFTETVIPRQRVDVDITNPAPGAGEVATTDNDVYRIYTDTLEEELIATGVAPNGAVQDWGVTSNREVTYRIVARSAIGSFAESV